MPRQSVAALGNKIDAALEDIESSGRTRLKIQREEDSGKFIYRIENPDTGETLRQWPPERYVELLDYLREGYGGIINQIT